MTAKNKELNLNNGKPDQKCQRYSNFNLSLNQNHKCLNVSVVHSISKSSTNSKNFDVFVVEKPEKGNLQSFWNKSSLNGSRNAYVKDEKETSKKKWKNDDKSANKKNSSTLSLHIAAYENSINGGDTVSLGENEDFNGKEKSNCLIKKCESISSTTIIQNSFEFPRQQTDDETNPAILNFTASQQLFNPNQQPMHIAPQQQPMHPGLMENLQSDCISSVRENFPGFFEKKDEVYPFEFEFDGKDSVEEGFPDVLVLSAYFTSGENDKEHLKADIGKSIFATAFKNKNFKDEEMDTHEISENDIQAENLRKIKNMTSEDIAAAREEILERFDPSIIEFLKRRKVNESKAENAAAGDSKKKVSKFRLKRMEGETETPKPAEEIIEPAGEEVKNLEFFNFDVPSGSEESAKFSRLAMNAVQMDLASKSYGLTAPRQQTAWISIFDKLAASTSAEKDDELVSLAIQNISKIKELYIEEVLVSENKTKLEFAADVKPASDGSWIFVPIRRVLDAVEDKRMPSADDAEIIRLTFLFSILFWKRQSTLMHMFGSPSDALCCVAETFLLGPEIYDDNIVDRAITVLLDEYFILYGQKGKLAFAATKPIARLDAFLPFYYDLMKKYEQYGGGSSNFSRILFVMACMNSVPQDAILLLINIWDPGCSIVRQCDISSTHMQPFLQYLLKTRKSNHFYVESELFLQYGRLLTLYAVAIRDEKIIRQRNPGLFNLAATEIGEFVRFWRASKQDDVARREEVTFLSERLIEATSSFINF